MDRALHHRAELVLDDIERRVGRSPSPPNDRSVLAAGGRRLAERFLWASTVYLQMDFGTVVAVIDGVYLGRLLSSEREHFDGDFQFVYGEGPGIEAAMSDAFIEVRDFGQATRWPALAPATVQAGCQSAWCIPLPHPDKPGLVLQFAGRHASPFTLQRYERLSRVTRIAQALLVDHPGTITAQTIQCRIDSAVHDRATAYQASGVLAARLSIDVGSALHLMRLQAWAENRRLEDLSADLIGSCG